MARLAREEGAAHLLLARRPALARRGRQAGRQLRSRDPALDGRKARDQAQRANEYVFIFGTAYILHRPWKLADA